MSAIRSNFTSALHLLCSCADFCPLLLEARYSLATLVNRRNKSIRSKSNGIKHGRSTPPWWWPERATPVEYSSEHVQSRSIRFRADHGVARLNSKSGSFREFTGHLLLILAFVPFLATGCSTSRNAIVENAVPSNVNHSLVASTTPDSTSSEEAGENGAESAVSRVAYQADEAALNPPRNALELVGPVELEAAPLPDHFDQPKLTLEAIEQLAIENNPAIQQAAASAHKAMGFHDQVGRNPNPNAGYNGSQLADAGTDQHSLFIDQEFVRGDKLERNQAVLKQEVQSQLWEVETQRYRVLTDVRQRFYDTLAAQRRLELATEFHAVAEKGVTIAQARREAAEGTVPEVLQAEIQFRQIVILRRQAEVNYRGAWKQLMAMTGTPDLPLGKLIGALPDSAKTRAWEVVETELMASSPELQAARSRVSRARAYLDRQQVQTVPNLTVMMGAGVDNATDSGFINTQVGLPLPIFNRNEGNISAAHAELCRASQEVRRMELAIKSRLAQAGQQYDAAAVAVEQYEQEILPRAQTTLDLTERAYSEGQLEFLQTLVVRRTFFDAKQEYVSAQRDLAHATALIEGLMLSGGLDATRDTEFDSSVREQSLSGR